MLTFFMAGEGGRGDIGTLVAVTVRLCGERIERVVSPSIFVDEATVVLRASLKSRPESSSDAVVLADRFAVSTTPCRGRAGNPSINPSLLSGFVTMEMYSIYLHIRYFT